MTESALPRSLAILQPLTEAAAHATCVIENGVIVEAGGDVVAIFGRDASTLIGQSFDTLLQAHNHGLRLDSARLQHVEGVTAGERVVDLEVQSTAAHIDHRELWVVSLSDVTTRNRSRDLVQRTLDLVGSKIGIDFLTTLVEHLARTLHVDFAFVAEILEGSRMRTLAAATPEGLITDLVHGYPPDPDGTVPRDRVVWHRSGVRALYPDAPLLNMLQIEGYAAAPLVDNAGQSIGILGIMSHSELPEDPAIAMLLEIYAMRAAGEVLRRRSELEMRSSRDYLDNLFDTANVLIVELDREGRVTRLNRMGETISGYKREELIGRNWFAAMAPPGREPFVEIFTRAVREGLMPREDEGALITPGGEERIINWRNSEILDGDGDVAGIIAFGMDVTEQRRAEAEKAALQSAMAQTAAEWRATFDAVNTPILIVRPDGTVSRVNRCAKELLGKEFRDIVGQALSSVSDAEPWHTSAALVRHHGDDGCGVSAEAKDAQGRTWNISIAHYATDDRAARCILVLWDTTSIVELQESLSRTERLSAMGTLVAGVAHEVRNPLFGISATLDAFEHELDELHLVDLNRALRREVNRLTRLMQDLLEYGKPSVLSFERVPLMAIVSEALRGTEGRAQQAQVTLSAETEGEVAEVRVDVGRMRQVFENLIDNAIQHSPRGGNVQVIVRQIERSGRGLVEARVEDGGSGFRSGDLERVFEPFFTRRDAGTGLGLSIVHRIIDEHSGTIEAANRPEGGAVITLRLPPAG